MIFPQQPSSRLPLFRPCFADPDNPTFRDLYLDVVLTSKLELVTMDREELDAALESGGLDKETYAFAVKAWQTLLSWLEPRKQEIVDYVTKVYREMVSEAIQE